MNFAGRKNGFTIVELMVAMLSAALLAAISGAILFYAYTGWRRNTAAVELQRDGTVAIDMLARAVRHASASDVTISAGKMEVQKAASTVSFTASGSDLVYDPDTGSGGDEVTVIDGRLSEFTPTNALNGVGIRLVLEDGEETTQIDSMLIYRN